MLSNFALVQYIGIFPTATGLHTNDNTCLVLRVEGVAPEGMIKTGCIERGQNVDRTWTVVVSTELSYRLERHLSKG